MAGGRGWEGISAHSRGDADARRGEGEPLSPAAAGGRFRGREKLLPGELHIAAYPSLPLYSPAPGDLLPPIQHREQRRVQHHGRRLFSTMASSRGRWGSGRQRGHPCRRPQRRIGCFSQLGTALKTPCCSQQGVGNRRMPHLGPLNFPEANICGS